MLKPRTVGTMLCLGALAALPACSTLGGMFGGNEGGSSQYRQSSYNRPAYDSSSYGSPQSAMQQTPQPGTTVTREAAITPRMIRSVQRRLKHGNLYAGRIDGVWGPMTQRGVREWQRRHNQNATGQLDVATLQAMNIGSGSNTQYGADNGPNRATGMYPANGSTQPNYSTAGSHRYQNGSSYSSNNPNDNMMNTSQGSQPNTNPPNNGMNGNASGSGGTGQPGH